MSKVLFTRPGMGSANPSLIVVTQRGQFFLKQRNSRYCNHDQLLFDHAVIHHMSSAGLPVTAPLKTLTGSRWFEDSTGIYELYPLIKGQSYTPGDRPQLAAAGSVLGEFHRAGRTFVPAVQKPLYHRLFRIEPSGDGLRWARKQLTGVVHITGYTPAGALEVLDCALAAARQVETGLDDTAFFALPQTIVHGDWHPDNLKFDGDQVAGIFDFDWCGRQPRMVDFVDGLLFFCSLRKDVDPSDIRSLTQAFVPDLELMQVFAGAYVKKIQLSAPELAAIPNLMRTRWLHTRVFPMMHKVPDHEKLSFLIDELDKPLRWIDANAKLLASGEWLGG